MKQLQNVFLMKNFIVIFSFYIKNIYFYAFFSLLMLFVCIKNLFSMPTTDKWFVHQYIYTKSTHTYKPEPLSEVEKKENKNKRRIRDFFA